MEETFAPRWKKGSLGYITAHGKVPTNVFLVEHVNRLFGSMRVKFWDPKTRSFSVPLRIWGFGEVDSSDCTMLRELEVRVMGIAIPQETPSIFLMVGIALSLLFALVLMFWSPKHLVILPTEGVNYVVVSMTDFSSSFEEPHAIGQDISVQYEDAWGLTYVHISTLNLSYQEGNLHMYDYKDVYLGQCASWKDHLFQCDLGVNRMFVLVW